MSRLKITEHRVDDPEKCLAVFKSRSDTTNDKVFQIEKQVGKGDYGEAFLLKVGEQNHAIDEALSPTGRYVLKKVLFPTREAKQQFISEVVIGKTLGEMGIAPKIYNYWFCIDDSEKKTYGYFVMELLSGVWSNGKGDRYDINHRIDPRKNRQRELIKLLGTPEHQQQLIDVITQSVNAGYLHQDCHVGNIGFVMEDGEEKTKLFDFGLTVSIPEECGPCFENEHIRNLCIASQLYIVIEQYRREAMFAPENLLYQEIVKLADAPEKAATRRIIDFSTQKLKIKELIETINRDFTTCCDIIKQTLLMTYLYQVIESYSIDDTYSTADYEELEENYFPGLIYDLIYYIRQGKFAPGNFTYEALLPWFAEMGIPEKKIKTRGKGGSLKRRTKRTQGKQTKKSKRLSRTGRRL